MKLSKDRRRLEQYIQTHGVRSFLPEEAVERLELCCFSGGEYLCREGEPARWLYLMADGHCKVTSVLANGREAQICFYRTFAVLGEFELIEGREAVTGTNAQAVDETWCLRLPVDTMRETLMNSVPFLQFLCRGMCAKAMRTNRNFSINLNYPVVQRVAGHIVCTAKDGRFKDNYTHLAEYLGCSHRQLLRTLRRLCEEGILSKTDREYRIVDENRLNELAAERYGVE